MLGQVLPGNLYAFFLVFARIGGIVMLLPGFGEAYVSTRIRLLLALALAAAIMPVVADVIPKMPDSPIQLFIYFGIEITIGVFLGMAVRILVSALQMAGTVIAYQTSLANAFIFDPASAQQGALTTTFLATTGVLLIFATNLHHVMIAGMVDSYKLLAAGDAAQIADMSEATARLVGRAFVLAMQIATPFVVVGLLFSFGVGLVNRLMPQVQMFFIAMPLQIAMGFLVLLLTISAALLWFIGAFESGVRGIFGGA
jgi:flagellar biosynthetic protein FliR